MATLLLSNPFKTPEFLALFKEWNQKLRADGLNEIEDFSKPEAPLKSWHDLRWKSESAQNQMENASHYFEKAHEVLHDYFFKTENHRKIWELHCEGKSVREIAETQEKLTKSQVHRVIVFIQVTSGIKNG